MRNRIVLLSLSTALALASVPVLANKGQSASHGSHATAAKSSSSGPKGTHGASSNASTPKNGHETPTTTTSAKGGGNKNSSGSNSSTSNTTSTTTTSTSTTSTSNTFVPTNPVAQKLSTKPNLMARARTILPPGTDLNLATNRFKNFGQFVAAMNVSRNLNIDFGQLKTAMTGANLAGVSTGTGNPLSLGQAIHQLRPELDGKAEATRAERQAAADID